MEKSFGFIHDKLDIKILILFILQRLPDAIPLEQLAELALCDEGINYFDYAECASDLIRTGHIEQADEGLLITEKGRTNGRITESSIPYSVRLKADKSAATIRSIMKRNAMISAFHTPRLTGGYTVSLSMSDGIGAVISMELLTGTVEQADQLEMKFKKNAEELYQKIIKLILES